MRRYWTALLLTLVCAVNAAGQGSVVTRRLERDFTFFYRLNGTVLDSTYMDNAQRMEDARQFFSAKAPTISWVTVSGWASPEGSYRVNSRLAGQRVESTRDFILGIADISPQRLSVNPRDENWDGLLDAAVGFDVVPGHSLVLDILRNNELTYFDKKERLKELEGGKTFRFITEKLMPSLRYTHVVASWNSYLVPVPGKPYSVALQSPVPERLMRPAVQAIQPAPAEDGSLFSCIALKTNALYDALTILNYSVELPIGNHFSVAWDHYFPWWHVGNKFSMQYLTLALEGRWWFSQCLTGHFIGLYGLWGRTDIQVGRAVGGYQVPTMWSTGLRYGYAFPISDNWNMELSVAAGYARLEYQHYTPSDDWSLLWKDPAGPQILSWLGPTNIAVSFVRPIAFKKKSAR